MAIEAVGKQWVTFDEFELMNSRTKKKKGIGKCKSKYRLLTMTTVFSLSFNVRLYLCKLHYPIYKVAVLMQK